MNRAIAVAEIDGPEAGLAILDRLDLGHYRYFHSTRAEFLRRAGRDGEAQRAYRRALDLAQTEPEQRFLADRLAEAARRAYARGDSTAFASLLGRAVALVASDARTAVFRAADGELVASDRSASDAISPDGAFVADAAVEGSLAILDLRTGTRVALQTATARPLDSVSYGPTADILVAEDREGDVHVVRCEICAGEDALLQRARTTLARISRFEALHPPVTATA